MQRDFHDLRFNSIQTLRGLAAILVVAEHIRFLACGAFGVDIFFCISSFMIMFTTHKSTEHFFCKRLLRIVPLYYFMTIGTYCLLVLFPSMFEQTSASLSQLIKSLLFIPFDMGNGILQPLMRIGWTVNCEMFFYLLFRIAYHISHKYRGLICSLLLLLTTAIGAIASKGNTLSGASLLTPETVSATDAAIISPWLAPVFFYGNPIMLEFALGILCYYIARFLYDSAHNHSSDAGYAIRNDAGHSMLKPGKANQSDAYNSDIKHNILRQILNSRSSSYFALSAGLLGLVLLFVTADNINVLGYRRLLIWGLPAMAVVLCFFTAGLTLHMPRFSIKLGDISFSLYLIHYYPIMLLDRKIFDFSTLTARSAIGAIGGAALVILLSIPVWYFIEKKLTGWLRGRMLH